VDFGLDEVGGPIIATFGVQELIGCHAHVLVGMSSLSRKVLPVEGQRAFFHACIIYGTRKEKIRGVVANPRCTGLLWMYWIFSQTSPVE